MRLPGGLSGAVDVLVGDGGGGVDAIEHDIGANLLQELVECRTVQPLCVEFAQDVLDQLCTRLRLCQELSSGDILPLLADEDIAPARFDLGGAIGEEGTQLGACLFGFALAKGGQYKAAWGFPQKAAAERRADQSPSAQNQDCCLLQLHRQEVAVEPTWQEWAPSCGRARVLLSPYSAVPG
jgi:hypothetical protein